MENDILKLFRGCRKPGEQVRIVADLTARPVAEVLEVLKRHGEIPEDVDEHNYKKRLKARYWRVLTEAERRYIVGSLKYPQELAKELCIPLRQVNSVLRKAAEEACKNGKRTDD